MNRTEEQATDIQIGALRRFGYVADHVLTRSEASQILTEYQHGGGPTKEQASNDALRLRKVVEQAKTAAGQAGAGAAAHQELEVAIAQRQTFWCDTCQEMTHMHFGWPEVIELYKQNGCRFCVPTREQAQEILDALDSALPTWDLEHPDLFYQTLQLNFPELVRRH